MPPEITLADVLTRLDAQDELIARMYERVIEVRDLANSASVQQDERLGAIEADLARLAKLADEAAPFLDSPVARYLARMRKLKADGAAA